MMLSPPTDARGRRVAGTAEGTPLTPQRTPARLPAPQPGHLPAAHPVHLHLHARPQASPPASQSTPSRRPRLRRDDWPLSPSPTPTPPKPKSQHQPEADSYLADLVWLAQCKSLRNPTPAMADFLSSFNLGPETAAPSNSTACESTDELRLRLHSVLDAKTTPTRAEHVSTTLELRSSAQFTLNLSDSENDALEGLSNIDPSLGAVRSATISAENGGAQPVRVVTANETLMSQPENDPVLQRSVAKLIISAVSTADGSAWTLRQVSRATQGWTFTYVCKDSVQQWRRQHSKSQVKAIIGEYSMSEPNPTVANRPAFDCRGSITIAFSRNSRSIAVRYNHTPLHKTVAQLAENFKPPPRQLGPGALAQQQKTPKKTVTEGGKSKRKSISLDENGDPKPPRERNLDDHGNPKPPRKRNLGENGNPKPPRKRNLDENGNPKPSKRRKKTTAEAQPMDGPVMPPDYPGAPPLAGTSQPGPHFGQQPADEGTQGFSDYPQGLVGDGPAQAQANSANTASFPVNVSAAEAARRREVATAMLSQAGVEPETLSAEQFSIFSNQSPELQKESLSMLAKYGAERLRIVHPSNRDSSTSVPTSASATPVQATQPTPSGPMTTKELVPQTQDSETKKGGRKRKSTARAVAMDDEENALQTETPTKSRARGGKSRVACFQCKERKTKCPREKPVCVECQAAGMTCEYPPQKPRIRKKKSDAIVIEDDEDEDEDEDEQGVAEDPQLGQPEPHEGMQQEYFSSHTHVPVADLLTPNAEPSNAQTQPTYFQQPQSLGLSQMSGQALSSASGLVLPHGQQYDSTQNRQAPIIAAPQSDATVSHTASPKQSKRKAGASASKNRRSLPSGPAQQSQASPAVRPLGNAGWPSANNVQPPVAPSSTISPTVQHRQQHSRGSNRGLRTDSPEVREGLRQAAAVQRQNSPSVAAATQPEARVSPFQLADNPRSKSRQSLRAQSRTPHAQSNARTFQTPTAPPPHPQAGHDAATRQVAADLTDMATYDPYARHSDNGTTNDASNTRIGYEPYAQQKSAANASSFPSYDYSRNNATTMSMAGQTATTMAPVQYSNGTNADSWTGSQNRDAQENAHGGGATYNGPNYGPGSGNNENPAPLHSFNMRAANQSTRSDLGSLNQRNQQPQGYGTYPAPPQQQANQQPGWYSLNGMQDNGSRYNWKMQDSSWSGIP